MRFTLSYLEFVRVLKYLPTSYDEIDQQDGTPSPSQQTSTKGRKLPTKTSHSKTSPERKTNYTKNTKNLKNSNDKSSKQTNELSPETAKTQTRSSSSKNEIDKQQTHNNNKTSKNEKRTWNKNGSVNKPSEKHNVKKACSHCHFYSMFLSHFLTRKEHGIKMAV